MARAFVNELGERVTISRERRPIAGRTLDVLRAHFGDAPMAFVAQEGPGKMRVLTCISHDRTLCDGVFAALLSAPWGEPAPGTRIEAAASRPLELLGRKVAVPAGCTSNAEPDGGGVACPPVSMVMWRYTDRDPDTAARAYEAWAVTDVLKGKRGRTDTVPCRIGARAATCRRVHVVDSVGESAVVVTTSVRVDGRTLGAACVAPGATGASIPCSLIIQLQ